MRAHDLEAAEQTAERRITEAPGDLEARGWHARVLAWRGQWAEAESEYRFVLRQAPRDSDILKGLADVLTWQQREREALRVLDEARALQPTETDILIRRARLLAGMGRTREARAEFRQILALEPSNAEVKSGLSGLAELTTHELRVGADIDTFNYTDPAQAYAINLRSRWTQRWSTLLGTSFYQRFGESATKFTASTAYQFTSRDWINIGAAVARDRGVIPRSETFFEYGHAFKLHEGWLRGLESSYQQRWLWYRNARVLTLNNSTRVSPKRLDVDSVNYRGTKPFFRNPKRVASLRHGETRFSPSPPVNREYFFRGWIGELRFGRPNRQFLGPHLRGRASLPSYEYAGHFRIRSQTGPIN